MATPKVKTGDIIDCKDLNGDYTGIACVVKAEDGFPVLIERKDGGWERSDSVPKSYKKKYNDRYWNVTRGRGESYTIVGGVGGKKSSSKPLKFSSLEALVIDKAAKDEIIAVMQQHAKADTLFTKWGLGETIKYGKGMSFLFYGGPGTGKTWAATLIAKAMGKELMVLGPAEFQSSEPGACNRNIQQAFTTAKDEDKVLFFDECDSIISSRNTLGMILAGEVNTLLTEIEKYEGVLILATNRAAELDEALERRISLIIEFKEPNTEQRAEIWRTLIPKKLPLAHDVTIEKLAEYKLTGGQIKNVLLQAARLALADNQNKVSFRHFEAAIQRVVKSKNLLGTASRYVQVIRQDIGAEVETEKGTETVIEDTKVEETKTTTNDEKV